MFRKDYPLTRSYVASIRTIPAGTFVMGNTTEPLARQTHTVQLSSYKLGSTPVTVGMWKEYCKAKGNSMPDAPNWGHIDSHPVVNVSWDDILGPDGEGGYCRWVTGVTGVKLTLPTEAQFEYAACGANKKNRFPWGTNFDRTRLWCSVKKYGDVAGTAPVNRVSRVFRNAYGLSDMVGNVSQWCYDWYGDYSLKKEINPVGPANPSVDEFDPTLKNRIIRGGDWYANVPEWFHCSGRKSWGTDISSDKIGFRLAVWSP